MEDAQTLGNFYYTVSLDGVNYQLVFKYNGREDFWYFDILDTEDNPIRSGIKVVSNWPLLRLMKNEPRPPGELMGIDTRDIALDPHLEEFGVEVVFGYIEEGTDLG